MLTVTVKFVPAAPASGKTLSHLRTTVVDAGGTSRNVDKSAAQIAAEAVLQPDGSYTLAVQFPVVAVGPYTLTAQAMDTTGGAMGAPFTSSGTVALADGVWFPQVVAAS